MPRGSAPTRLSGGLTPAGRRWSLCNGNRTGACRSAWNGGKHECRARLDQAARLLESVSYQSVLQRGFALVRDADGQPVKLAAALRPGDEIGIEFADGRVAAITASNEAQRPRKPAPKPTGGQGSLF